MPIVAQPGEPSKEVLGSACHGALGTGLDKMHHGDGLVQAV